MGTNTAENERFCLLKKRLLVIDDDPNDAVLMEQTLKDEYYLTFCDNASDAIPIGRKLIPHAILLDLDMEHINGHEFLRIVQNDPMLSDIPIIVTSADKSHASLMDIHEDGAAGVIYKPFNPRFLVRDIEGILTATEIELNSENERINFRIYYSGRKKQDQILELLQLQNFEEEPLVLLSWSRGEDFIRKKPELIEQIENNKLYFLEIKPSLISKFPYIQNIAPIVHEIKSFIQGNSRNFHLIMDEPRHILNMHQREKSLSKAYSISRLLNNEFNKVTYINSKPGEEKALHFLTDIGKILTGLSG